MTKTTTTEAPEQINESATPELSDAQVYEEELQQALDEWTEEALTLLEAKIRSLDLPRDGRKFNSHTSDGLRGSLRNLGISVAMSWHTSPPRPKTAELGAQEHSDYDKDRAEQRRRVEKSHTHILDLKRVINESRERAYLPPLPEDDSDSEMADEG